MLDYLIGEKEKNTDTTSFQNHNSKILRQEAEGIHNLIFSNNKEDIESTVEILNESYFNSTSNFQRLARTELLHSPFKLLANPVESIEKISKVIGNYASAKLMNDNFYAFSYNQTLLNMNIDQIKNMP